MKPKQNLRTIASAGIAISALFLMTACGGENDGQAAETVGTSIPIGASIEEYHAAFEDIEPITLQMQVTSGSGESFGGQAYEQFAQDVHEWSDGKVTININWTGTVVPVTEVDDALADGRLDLGLLTFIYEPETYPVSNSAADLAMVDRSTTPLVGLLAEHMAMMQVPNETPEIFEEYETKGLTPLLAMNPQGPLGFACSEPIEASENLQGKTVVPNSVTQGEQIEALGGTVSSLEWTEMFEGLQRGIADCVATSYIVAAATGIPEVAPYFYIPEDTSFQGSANATVAGSSWETLPLPVRQVVYDKLWNWMRYSHHGFYRHAHQVNEIIEEQGGEHTYFGPGVNEELIETNAGILEERTSTELFDAQDYASRYDEAMAYWSEQAEANGITDSGEFGDIEQWYQGDLDSPVPNYPALDEFYDMAFEEVAANARPQ